MTQALARNACSLGTDADGNQHLPRVQNTPDKRYRLGQHVTCDWVTFQKHARQGLTDATEDGELALRRALALVRGRPFAGMAPQRYAWAEPTIQENGLRHHGRRRRTVHPRPRRCSSAWIRGTP
ncbi:hypothetical protein ACFYXM_32450 [Streptomyces sp. NPDC002476]|uniref:hypothetical protein n=1 Tax=Streptomyces sp. NPDC002476 TaxID=3364648 RepID=UPI003677956D